MVVKSTTYIITSISTHVAWGFRYNDERIKYSDSSIKYCNEYINFIKRKI